MLLGRDVDKTHFERVTIASLTSFFAPLHRE